jgi:hypothetical protein
MVARLRAAHLDVDLRVAKARTDMNAFSEVIANRLKTFSTSYYLYSIKGGTHSWAGVPTKKCFTEILDFLYNDVLYPKVIRQTELTIIEM